MIKVCGFRVSNYHNKVLIALLEKGVSYEEDCTVTPAQKIATSSPCVLAASVTAARFRSDATSTRSHRSAAVTIFANGVSAGRP